MLHVAAMEEMDLPFVNLYSFSPSGYGIVGIPNIVKVHCRICPYGSMYGNVIEIDINKLLCTLKDW